MACGILVPWQGIESTTRPLHWKPEVIITGLLGKSPQSQNCFDPFSSSIWLCIITHIKNKGRKELRDYPQSFLYFNDFRLGVILPCRTCLVLPGKISGCLEKVWMVGISASSGWRPGMLQVSYQGTGQALLSHSAQNIINARFEKLCCDVSEKAMAPHSSTLAWKIPWAEEPGRLQSMGSWRVEHDWMASLSLFTFVHWRRKWQPTPVFLPGESQGQGSLVGCHLWGCTESDTTEAT